MRFAARWLGFVGPIFAAFVVSAATVNGQSQRAETTQPASTAGPREWLGWRGIDTDRLGRLVDGVPWQKDDDELLLETMYWIRQDFRPGQIERWARDDWDVSQLARQPETARADIFRIQGRIVSIDTRRLSPEIAERF